MDGARGTVPLVSYRNRCGASRQVIAVELQGHGHTADTGRPMTIEALAGDVVAPLDHLGIAEADLLGFSLGGLVAYAVALGAPARVGKLIVASADAHRPPGRESAPPGDDRIPTLADFQAMRDAYDAAAPAAHFDELAAKTSTMVHEFPGWTDELRSLQVPTLLIFGDRDFTPLPDVVEMLELLPNAQLAVLPGTRHVGVTRRPGEVFALITPFLDALMGSTSAISLPSRWVPGIQEAGGSAGVPRWVGRRAGQRSGVEVSDLVDALGELPAVAGALVAVVVDGVVQV